MPIRTDPPSLLNPDGLASRLEGFIEEGVRGSGARGVVVNLSGGIDSTVAATLATEALGSDQVTGLVLPTSASRSANMEDAIRVAEELVIDYRVIELQSLLDAFTKAVSTVTRDVRFDPMEGATATMTVPVGPRNDFTRAVGNAAARMRMMVAYFEANTTDLLVLGTGNRTELQLGYFTKYGDGGVDLLPLGDLYKREVRQLGRTLGVREDIITKDPTAGLWEGQADEIELGATYELIDTILWNLSEEEVEPAEIATALDIEGTKVERFARMRNNASHKRRMPPSPGTRDIRIDRG